MRFDSPSPQTPHPNYDGPSSTPTEVEGSSTPTATPDNRLMICLLGFSFDNNLCKRDISRIIQSKFEGPYPSWKKTDPAVREVWYGEFKSRQFGRPPTQAELFLATHRRKDNFGFVDRRFEDTYLTLRCDNTRHHHSHRLLAIQKIVKLASLRTQLLTIDPYGWRLRAVRKRVVFMEWGQRHI
ncbi:uncharacterized protein LOC127800418 isoform X2 [Diospyros lotus]|nr:uncharacterized protein LOC127800418 isoform X2 [Diospyros lotus]